MVKITIEQFIRDNKKLFSKPELERMIGMPEKTLQRVVNGRNLPDKYKKKLIDFIQNLGDNISQF